MNALDIVAALQVLAQSALTAQQISALLAQDNITEADVIAQLNKTDATIDRVKTED